MKKPNKFSPEVRERAVCMVQEHCGEYPLLWVAIESIAPKLAALERVAWFNHHRLLAPIGYIPPAEAEENYYRQLAHKVTVPI